VLINARKTIFSSRASMVFMVASSGGQSRRFQQSGTFRCGARSGKPVIRVADLNDIALKERVAGLKAIRDQA